VAGVKLLGGRRDVVTLELRKLHAHLLGPLGVATVPSNLGHAVVEYQAARDKHEKAFHFQVSRAAETTVLPSLIP